MTRLGSEAVDIRTEPATGKAESIQQFRSLFQQHEPKLLAFADSLLNEFGRENISAVRIFCPLDIYERIDADYKDPKEVW